MYVFDKIDAFIKQSVQLFLADYLPSDAEQERETIISTLRSNPPSEGKIKADYSTNAAMVITKSFRDYNKRVGQNVLDTNLPKIANEIAEKIKSNEYVASIAVMGGYINIIFSQQLWCDVVAEILSMGADFGVSEDKKSAKVNLEFVSANPTGPLHIGHCRGAIIGAALARIMEKAGYDVTKEYYMNDYGVQIHTLLESVRFRYEQLCGHHKNEEMPDGCYPGEYITEYARTLYAEFGNAFDGLSADEFYAKNKQRTVDAMMDRIRSDLKLLNVEMDVFTSETKLVESNAAEQAIETLGKKGYTRMGSLEKPAGNNNSEDDLDDYTPEEHLLFESTRFGDDKDRVLRRANGQLTYFASDIANHKDKFDRGFTELINIFGADHGGYVARLNAAVRAVTDDKATLKVLLCQMVSLEKDGVEFKMSKRKGTFILVSDLAQELDIDELKLFMLSRNPDAQMVFDTVKIKEQSKDNIVYYILYAYARTNSLLNRYYEKTGREFAIDPKAAAFSESDYDEAVGTAVKGLIEKTAEYPNTLLAAAKAYAPNILVDYLKNLAGKFHSLWSSDIKFISDNAEQTYRNMAVVKAVQTVLSNALACCGIEPRAKM